MFSRLFWRDAVERALSTAAQSALLVIGADQVNVVSVDWVGVAGFAAGGAALSLLKAVAASKLVGDNESASLDPQQANRRRILGKA